MEHDPRPFQAVNIGMTSVETGIERFSSDNDYYKLPLSTWRCNLTALSQRYNLYFISTRAYVAVYQPEFPFQKLNRTPKLNIAPTLANPTAAGYIDERRPHSINHLMVGDLGTEEILLVATDSGNVAAYHTKAIEEAIKRDPYKFSADGRSDYVGLRAFFAHWVHESAWGLAVHRESRMIAVSANTPHHVATNDSSAKITVFAFALTEQDSNGQGDFDDPDSEAPEEQQDWYDWDPNLSSDETPYRDRNFKIVLGGDNGHINNIPSVSFVNNPEDPDGSWILSTDITGIMKLWRIWRGRCYASYDCEGADGGVGMRRQRDAGWIVAALDPSAFRPALSMDQFCGFHRPRSAPQYQGHPGESYDITNIVRLKTPGRSQKHPLMDQDSDDEVDTQHEAEEIVEEWTDEEVEEPDRKRDLVLGLHSLSLPANGDRTPPLTQTRSSSGPSEGETFSTAIRDGEDDRPLESLEALDTAENTFLTLQPANDVDDPDDMSDGSDPDEEEIDSSSGSPASYTSISSTTQRTSVDVEATPLLDTSPEHSGDSTHVLSKKPAPVPAKRQRHDRDAKGDNIRIPSIAALQCSQFHVRIINIPKARSPHFFCANILTQDLPDAIERSNFVHLNRLSMMQQIPELGIVIVASQLGRCAVCTMTQNVSNGALGLRVDWMLPTRRQERAGHRPSHPIVGIAVAPVQGRALQRPDPTVEQDDQRDWAKDGIVNGVKTTFDKSVLILDAKAKDNKEDESSSDDEHPTPSRRPLPSRIQGSTYYHNTHSRSSKSKPQRKRLRHTPPSNSASDPRSSLSSVSSQASTSVRPFPPPQHTESWAAVEPSRRYRLMLTYLEGTVLTYELDRGVEREDVKGCESWRTSASSSGSAGEEIDVDSEDIDSDE